MAPLTPHWQQPSHPDVQEVVINDQEFTTKSYSKVTLPPFAVFAKLTFPPCTVADEPTYATVQMGRHSHLNLNSDLLYINHSCEPSLIFDTGNMDVLVGPNGLKPGDELTFFYPSTEWDLAQPFTCLCGHPTCHGTISGAKHMTPQQLHGVWLNGHIRDLLEEKHCSAPSDLESDTDPIARALTEVLLQAEKGVQAARRAIRVHAGASQKRGVAAVNSTKKNGVVAQVDIDMEEGLNRRGLTSRELSGEMGGDTVRA
ncbi:Post-SET domain protein [Metarhizium album ARSEF 1941]|uniref:Post-SET domain protein n=1 Tax=Metarhizium album (strain ARSEF 1941) TaxID=1081103 RepID=A0A0B2X1Z6_METAS|nr:Post-SET domain protein [Metarhizium album ARSEF 1941]KHN99195.1 Post-SET domain protein [Metarhizium album ARSEF 1941]